MVSEVHTIDIRTFLVEEGHSAAELLRLRRELCRNRAMQSELADLAERLIEDTTALGTKLAKSAALRRRGIALWLLGKLEEAEKVLSEAGSGAEFELGWCRLELGLYDQAIEVLETVPKDDSRYDRSRLFIAEADTRAGRTEKSLAALEELIASSPSAEAFYQLGLACDGEGRYADAVNAYEKTIELDPDHHPAIFRLGYAYVLAGDPERAMGHYKRLAGHHPMYPSALINLGIIYEDAGQLEKAIECYELVLKTCPTHRRARLYLRDAVAATDMYYDPEEQKERTRKNEILSIPITDFELSVRARNCLAKMNILSLGDLVMKSQGELLAYKNFGDTSLTEITEILESKGLSLDAEWILDEIDGELPLPVDEEDEEEEEEEEEYDEDDILAHPTVDLQLSVRCRKCLERLGINTIGDLTNVTEDELLSMRNFGRTSLDEIKSRLSAHGLSLSDGTQRGL